MTSTPKPLCFVLMPFGRKADGGRRWIDFDALYEDVFVPAIRAADLQPIRADEERQGGIIHKAMFERLVLCPFALADLTLANANVFYELGIRHVARPHATVLVYDKGGQRLPFDVAPLRAVPYETGPDGRVVDADGLLSTVRERLLAAKTPKTDSPVYELLDGFGEPDVARLKTDVFRDRVQYNEDIKARLKAARRSRTLKELDDVCRGIGPLGELEAGVAVDVLLSYRALGAFQRMVEVSAAMHPTVASSVLVREQRAFALNRIGQWQQAEELLQQVLHEQGPSSETFGLLGRVYKDRWEAAAKAGRDAEANGFLTRAIAAYRRGFEADCRDAFPGINAATLMEVEQPGQEALQAILPVVRFAVERRLQDGAADYWDHATLLELSVLERDPAATGREFGECLACSPEDWQRETTARNLTLILEARRSGGEDVSGLTEVVTTLRTPR